MKHLEEYIKESVLATGLLALPLIGLLTVIAGDPTGNHWRDLYPELPNVKDLKEKLVEARKILNKYKKDIKGDEYHYPILNKLINQKRKDFFDDFYYMNNGKIQVPDENVKNIKYAWLKKEDKMKWVEKDIDKDLLAELDMLLSNEDFNKIMSILEYFKANPKQWRRSN